LFLVRGELKSGLGDSGWGRRGLGLHRRGNLTIVIVSLIHEGVGEVVLFIGTVLVELFLRLLLVLLFLPRSLILGHIDNIFFCLLLHCVHKTIAAVLLQLT
jgi:hypothetical protein